MAMNIIDIVLDAWILTLPIPVIRSLHMTPKRKIAVAGVFLLGALYISYAGKAVEYANIKTAASFHPESGSTTPVSC